jgi:hypothetical protein
MKVDGSGWEWMRVDESEWEWMKVDDAKLPYQHKEKLPDQ